MERVIPVLSIDEYDAAIRFYVQKLKFNVLFEHRHEPGFPVYMVVQNGNGNLTIGLSEHGKEHQGSEIYLIVNNIDEWHRRCVENKVPLESGPTRMPWGNTEMLVKDPFRNALRFTQERTHAGQNTPNKSG